MAPTDTPVRYSTTCGWNCGCSLWNRVIRIGKRNNFVMIKKGQRGSHGHKEYEVGTDKIHHIVNIIPIYKSVADHT